MSVFSSGLASRFQASFDRVPHVVIGKAVPHVHFAFYVRCLSMKSRLVVLKDLHGSAASVRRLNASEQPDANKPNLPPFFPTTLPHHIHGVPKLFHTLLPIPIVQGRCIRGSTGYMRGYSRGYSRGELNGLDSRRKIRKTVVTRKFFVSECSKKITNQIHLEMLQPPKLA
ncbi:hypothetical protein CPAR01_02200 [Colletotrichum paranaense]|uniref:Uncharacterized protein n=1 Tax=Colletotrichum paranaense TaxID=1914294 RepID=A0ABQ9SYT7_9PEZI|nr:uncharacterized protein CPAR01_02200 [Colletotrichum paranaense]KAK1544698.1 hypothetical protein CPAR01_02200 [Colletotrichum paranaense]